nr:MAG TPA: hypothetical protein [Caudoviricetes sp.]
MIGFQSILLCFLGFFKNILLFFHLSHLLWIQF